MDAAEKKPFDPAEWIDQVSRLKAQHTVEAEFIQLPGFKDLGLPGHLLFHCPACNHLRAISGEGKYLCICGATLAVKRNDRGLENPSPYIRRRLLALAQVKERFGYE